MTGLLLQFWRLVSGMGEARAFLRQVTHQRTGGRGGRAPAGAVGAGGLGQGGPFGALHPEPSGQTGGLGGEGALRGSLSPKLNGKS